MGATPAIHHLGELPAGPLLAVVFAALLASRDVPWFIDGKAALSTMITGANSKPSTFAF